MKEGGKQTNYWKNGTKMADIWQTVMKSSELELNQSAPAGGDSIKVNACAERHVAASLICVYFG